MKIYRLLLAGLVLTGLNACKETTVDQLAEAEKLMELSKDWAKSVQDRDVEKMLSYWADDAILMSENEAAVIGIDSLTAMVERSMKIPGFDINWNPQEAYRKLCQATVASPSTCKHCRRGDSPRTGYPC